MLEHFKGEEVFVKKVLEYQDQALYKQRLILTKFLNPYHQSIVKSIIGKNEDLQVKEAGGFKDSENRRLIIAPNFYEIEPEDFNITVIKISYPNQYEKLGHRDVMGAMMSMQINRELFGDIVEIDHTFYVAVDSKLYDFIRDNLLQIKHSKIRISKEEKELAVKNDYIVKSFIVSSFRLDKIIATFYKISRNKAAEYINAGYVKVNHKSVEQINYLCNNSDMISFKKHGRVKFVDCNRTTRSDNHVVEGYFYK